MRAFAAPCVKALVVEGGAAFARSRLDGLVERAKALGAKGLAWFQVAESDGATVLDSPLDRFLSDEPSGPACSGPPGPRPGTWCWWWPTSTARPARCWASSGSTSAGAPVGEGPYRYVWVVEFPMFDGVDAEGNPVPAHHPFTMPHPDDLDLLETDPAAVRSQAYDLVLNGWELGSGSVRIHRADIQARVFVGAGHLSGGGRPARFGFLLGAFRYGAPPHAGFAFGIDRLVAIFAGEENIREVIAFPKTQSGADPMTGAPKALAPTALAELGIRVVAPTRGGRRSG